MFPYKCSTSRVIRKQPSHTNPRAKGCAADRRKGEPAAEMEDLQNQDDQEPEHPAAAGADVLPADALEEILRRVPPRGLAACRLVCTSWRAAVDSNHLLRADLLPLSVASILIGFAALNVTELFLAPSLSSPVSARLDFLPRAAADDDDDAWTPVRDHCNGLLLLADHVANPATRRWDPLPPTRRPQGAPFLRYDSRLVYDPTMTPHHYEVVRIPTSRPSSVHDGGARALEWPDLASLTNQSELRVWVLDDESLGVGVEASS
ncbi:hypothetical protein PR202_ga30837 [Eleusine coracana subsp. coracana]|uniref:F-box domain-containing protein n=1 Tax=Eleusine coracana subsp. coracana TaxID=191504 RepID=A0AAV5DQZ3_ELECO|nr:hypothetical protein PR202_ga30837 [Eleusine coracana subsp. coracana]